MFEGITNWVEDKVAGYAKTGIQAGGTLAGNAVGGVGNLVENAGRTAGNTVSGGIGGVGGKIQNYGDGIKRSMSADGPASGGQQKTAVKPSSTAAKPAQGTQKAIGSAAGTAKKTIPSTGNAAARGGGAVQKPAPPPSKTNTSAAQRSKSAPTQPLQNVRNTSAKANAGGAPAARANVSSGPRTQPTAPKAASSVTGSGPKSNADGKIRISQQSMPKGLNYKSTAVSRPAAGPASGAAKSHDRKDPLGIGDNFGDMSTKSKGNHSKPQSQSQSQGQTTWKAQGGNDRKASVGDPLALGEDINKIGQGKK